MSRAQPSAPVLPVRGRRRGLAFATALAFVLGGCGCTLFRESGVGGDDAHWQISRWRGVNSAQVLTMAQMATDREFPTQKLDAYRGEFQTGWIYGMFDPVRRQPLRQRVVVDAKPEEGVVVVKLRAEQQINPASGSFTPKPDDDGWEPFDDDDRKATVMMQRLTILLKDVAELVPEPKPGEGSQP